MAAAYVVTLPVEGGHTLRGGVNAVVVYAEDANQAKEAAGALYGGDSLWTGATATVIAAGDYAGWSLNVRLKAPGALPGVYAVDVTVLGDATNNTIDELAALAVTALNATAINGAAYDSTTQVLKVAETTDNLGNHTLEVRFTNPSYELPVASLVASKVDGGIVAAAVTATLRADAVVPPKLYGVFHRPE